MSFQTTVELANYSIDPVAALSLEVDEEKVTQWQRPGLGCAGLRTTEEEVNV